LSQERRKAVFGLAEGIFFGQQARTAYAAVRETGNG